MPYITSLRKQIKDNILAIISIFLAITALGYNSWRNELSEENRNYRTAGLEILRESAQLQLIVDTATYSDNGTLEPIHGWVQVNLILSLAEIMPAKVKFHAVKLKQEWSDNWSLIATNKESNHLISSANEQLVIEVRSLLSQLN